MPMLNLTAEENSRVGNLARSIWMGLRSTGYEITRVSETPNIFYAIRDTDGERLLFAIRVKGEPTFRTKTQEYEFGIDGPDMDAYLNLYRNYPVTLFLVFFPTIKENAIYYGDIDDVSTKSRHWQDDRKFPRGIYFVRRATLKKLGD